jgi:hypothetical protein
VQHRGRSATKRLLDRLDVRDRHRLADDRTVDVAFAEHMADELGTLEQVHARAGIVPTDPARAEISAYQANHPRGKEGRVGYDLAVIPEEVRVRFGRYLRHYPVRIEV